MATECPAILSVAGHFFAFRFLLRARLPVIWAVPFRKKLEGIRAYVKICAGETDEWCRQAMNDFSI